MSSGNRLTVLFGTDYAFDDHTHDDRGLPTRHFTSLRRRRQQRRRRTSKTARADTISRVSTLERLDRFDVRFTQALQHELDAVQVSLIDRRPQRLG